MKVGADAVPGKAGSDHVLGCLLRAKGDRGQHDRPPQTGGRAATDSSWRRQCVPRVCASRVPGIITQHAKSRTARCTQVLTSSMYCGNPFVSPGSR